MSNELAVGPAKTIDPQDLPIDVVAHKAVWADGSWWVHATSGLVVGVWGALPDVTGTRPSVYNLTDTLCLVEYDPATVAVIK
jgi:hypothetical protein